MFLCCGEAVIDMIPETARDGAPVFRPVPGGAALNTAIALARLDQPVGFFGGLSDDVFGRTLRDAMAAEGIDLGRAPILDSPTTLAFIHRTETSQSFSFYDQDSATRSLSPLHLPPLDGISTLVFGGFCLIHRPAAGAFEALMQMAGAERVILLDPNIRPALIAEQDADYRKRLDRMMAMADVIKLSDEDIDWLRPDPPEQLLTGRASVVIHTHGSDGVTLFTRHGAQHVPAPAAKVSDTVGAGDTFNAGFLTGLAQADLATPADLARADLATLTGAAELGVRAATLSVTRPGANPPTLKELSCAP